MNTHTHVRAHTHTHTHTHTRVLVGFVVVQDGGEYNEIIIISANPAANARWQGCGSSALPPEGAALCPQLEMVQVLGGHELTQMCDPEAGDTFRTLSPKTVTGPQRTVDLRLRNTDGCSTPTSRTEDLPRQQGEGLDAGCRRGGQAATWCPIRWPAALRPRARVVRLPPRGGRPALRA